MSIKSYTYSNPYKLNVEPYWDTIKTCPCFCASQTLVNGFGYLFPNEYIKGRVTTIRNLVETLFKTWMSVGGSIKQHADIDNLLLSNQWDSDEEVNRRIINTVTFNREEVLESLRSISALNINPEDIDKSVLSKEQIVIVELYEKILESNYRNDFLLDTNLDETTVDALIKEALPKRSKEEGILDLDYSRIVLQGIHQFSPVYLRTIELLSSYKEVILLFNYQEQYANLYQTWIDIYKAFDSEMTFSKVEDARPSLANGTSYEGNVLGDNLGKLAQGNINNINLTNPIEILEFDNKTEFAGYIANLFEESKAINSHSPLKTMKEQFYAADASVNEILKIYFPEQFGERQFLNYPLGQFILSLSNLWDASSDRIIVEDSNDIKECLNAGIIAEGSPGYLLSLFNQVEPLFSDTTDYETMISRLKRIKKNKKRLPTEEEKEELTHISYYALSNNELDDLITALEELKAIALTFFKEFENKPNNFPRFYKRVKQYLQGQLDNTKGLNEEYADILRRVLLRLDEIETINATASFECLKSTMSVYLLQEAPEEKRANWIVRGFEQIDGDILTSNRRNGGSENVIYHFACLTDEDINSSQKSVFPWPLDAAFFEMAQNPIDWKSQVYVKSKIEYKNFKKYALVYGLEFNRSRYKLSYIKHIDEKEREPYYLLKMLGAKTNPYIKTVKNTFLVNLEDINFNHQEPIGYDSTDVYRYRICNYRFLLESIIEGSTIYKDSFLLTKYMEVLLENHLKRAIDGSPISETLVDSKLNSIYADLQKLFPYTTPASRMDVINTVRTRFLKFYSGKQYVLTKDELEYMRIRELFIHKQLYEQKKNGRDVLKGKFNPVSEDDIRQLLSSENLHNVDYRKGINIWCQYCSNREHCLGNVSQ